VTPQTKAAAEKRAKANERQRESRKRKREEKKRDERIFDGLESGDDAESMVKKVKKAKQAQKITVYIHIRAPIPRTKSRAKVPESKEIIKGPCFFTVDQDYDTFKEVIAKSIPCKPKLLPVAQMQWRYEKLANDG
jgi:predicted phosphoribosyltransferase